MPSRDYELLAPYGKEGQVTLGRRKTGNGYIYISSKLRRELKTAERVYCYVHKKGKKLLLSFTDTPTFLGYRTIKNPNAIIAIPGSLLAPYLKKNEKMKLPAHVEDGNVFVDLEELQNKEKEI